MDSPLNSAHQFARRAEAMLKSGNFEGAIQCHASASELILEAMTQTSSNYALESMNLQHRHHIKKMDLIQEKCNKIEKYNSKRISKGDNCANKECQTDNIEANIRDALFDVTDSPLQLQNEVYQSLAETDTLLNILENRCSSLTGTSGLPTSLAQRPRLNYNKHPKDSQTIIEELNIHNKLLRSHVEQMVNEIEQLKKEKNTLSHNLQASKENNLTCDISEGHFFQEDFYDLPPLEMPTLDPLFFQDETKETAENLPCEKLDALTLK
ncbi:hypothetical protein SNE40_008052 [Patella caerulea]|uniref:Nuclear receptor-binding factor 2 MIT domain-containing protein n=1 Tax=Patella caerulea TaxID=87958 RepID=A0AAN8K5X9_PATCE